ncbi:unnamed protein product, partial [Musa banksii]
FPQQNKEISSYSWGNLIFYQITPSFSSGGRGKLSSRWSNHLTYGRPPDQMPPLLLQICLIHLNWERNVSLDCQDHILSVIGKMMAFVIDLAINVLNDFYRVLAIMPWRDRS